MSITENEVRFLVRKRYREEGVLNTHKLYPLKSLERGWALSEEHKIEFHEELSSQAITGEP